MTEPGSANPDLAEKMAGGAAWVIGSRMAVRLIGVVSTLILVRLLVPSDFGLIALATLISASVEMFSAFNFDVWLIRHPKPGRAHYDTVWTLSAIRGLLTAVVLFLLAEPASLFFDQPRLSAILIALAGGSIMMGLKNVGIVDFHKHLDFDKEFFLLAVSKLSSFVVTIGVAFVFRSYWALVAGIISGNFLNLVLSFAMHGFRPRFSLKYGKEVFHFTKWLMVGDLLGFIYTRADVFILGKLLNTQLLGLYTVAHEIATLATAELVAPIRRVLLPGYSKMSSDIDRMRRAFIDGLGIILLIGIPCSLGIGLVADPLVHVFLGEKWLETIPLIQILVVYGVASVAMANQTPLLVALGRTRLVSQLVGFGVLVLLPAFVWASMEAGVRGGAWALGLTNSLLFFVSLLATLKVLKLSVTKVISAVWRIVGAGMAMVAVVLLIQQLPFSRALGPIAQLIMYSSCGALTYTASLFLLWHSCKRPDGPEKTIVDFVYQRLAARRQNRTRQAVSRNIETGGEARSNTSVAHRSTGKENILFVTILSFLPSDLVKSIREQRFLFLCFRVALLLGTFLLVDRYVPMLSHLPEERYEQSWLLLMLLQQLGVAKIFLLLALLMVLTRYGNLLSQWEVLSYGRLLRGFTVFLAFLMAWAFSTQGYNYYFDQGYWIDRLLIVLLLPLFWWRPIFIYPFIFLGYTFMWQWVTPELGGSILAHKLQVMKILNLFAAMLVLHGLTGSRRSDDFIFLACCLLAGSYWEAALAKLELDWLSYGHLNHAFVAAYGHGWLGTLESSQVVEIANFLSGFDRPMQWYVLAIEAGCLVFLWRRSLSILLLINLTLFHTCVFAMYGFLFWPWIMLNLSMIVVLLKLTRQADFNIFDRGHFILSVLLIGFAGRWAFPAHLGWLDTRVDYTTEYTVIGESGGEYKLSPRFIEPYGDVFTFSPFAYLVKDHKLLAGAYGVTMNRTIADGLIEPVTPEQLFELEKQLGNHRYDATRAERHYNFLRRYLRNWNNKPPLVFDPAGFAPPPQFWSLPAGKLFQGEERIKQIAIEEVTRLFDDQKLRVVRRKELARIEIPQDL